MDKNVAEAIVSDVYDHVAPEVIRAAAPELIEAAQQQAFNFILLMLRKFPDQSVEITDKEITELPAETQLTIEKKEHGYYLSCGTPTADDGSSPEQPDS